MFKFLLASSVISLFLQNWDLNPLRNNTTEMTPSEVDLISQLHCFKKPRFIGLLKFI